MIGRRERCLLLCALILFSAVFITAHGARQESTPYSETQLEASKILEECFSAVKGYKAELGIHIDEADYHETGMIGESYTGITTTMGAVESKRTAAWRDMGALCVRMLYEAGIRQGDTVGAGFSGSFPGLDLAVVAACQAMDVRCVCISSVGASTYGANNELLTFPEMLHRLVCDGILKTDSVAVSLGGADDVLNEADSALVAAITERLLNAGLTLLYEPDFSENIAARREIYLQNGPIDCFVAVGGNLTSMGLGGEGISLGQGVLSGSDNIRLSPNSGLVQRYLVDGIPVINFLNLKKIMSDYSLPYDPDEWPQAGTSAVYYETHYPVLPVVIALSLTAMILALYVYAEKRNTHKIAWKVMQNDKAGHTTEDTYN